MASGFVILVLALASGAVWLWLLALSFMFWFPLLVCIVRCVGDDGFVDDGNGNLRIGVLGQEESSSTVCEATNNGRCFYIAPDGDNAGDASFDQPHKDAEYAISNAQAGDVIYFRGGTYGTENMYITAVSRRVYDAAPEDCDEFQLSLYIIF